MKSRRFALLDRDGTVIVNVPYLADPDDVALIEGAAAGMRRLAALGLGVVIVTNQSAIGRGLLDEPGLEAIHARLIQGLAAEEVRVDGIFHCPHHPDAGCICRTQGGPQSHDIDTVKRLKRSDHRQQHQEINRRR